MESIRGKHALTLDAVTLAARIVGYHDILIDIGTGDGRYVRHIAQRCPSWFTIGIDACRENLRTVSRNAPGNALFIIANALALPRELDGLATRITVNFPWGSLLAGLLRGDPGLLSGITAVARPDTTLEIRLNGGALAEAGDTLAAGVRRIQQVIRAAGFTIRQSAGTGCGRLARLPDNMGKATRLWARSIGVVSFRNVGR